MLLLLCFSCLLPADVDDTTYHRLLLCSLLLIHSFLVFNISSHSDKKTWNIIILSLRFWNMPARCVALPLCRAPLHLACGFCYRVLFCTPVERFARCTFAVCFVVALLLRFACVYLVLLSATRTTLLYWERHLRTTCHILPLSFHAPFVTFLSVPAYATTAQDSNRFFFFCAHLCVHYWTAVLFLCWIPVTLLRCVSFKFRTTTVSFFYHKFLCHYCTFVVLHAGQRLLHRHCAPVLTTTTHIPFTTHTAPLHYFFFVLFSSFLVLTVPANYLTVFILSFCFRSTSDFLHAYHLHSRTHRSTALYILYWFLSLYYYYSITLDVWNILLWYMHYKIFFLFDTAFVSGFPYTAACFPLFDSIH